MILKSFRIKNYKSIKDSGECYLSGDGTTILAGKNEAGKTAILEALEDFNTNQDIRQEAIPSHGKEIIPKIELKFFISKNELQKICDKIDFITKNIQETTLTITKDYPNQYSITFDKSNIKIEKIDTIENAIIEIADIYSQISNIHSQYPNFFENFPEFDSADIEKFTELAINFRAQTQQFWPNLEQADRENYSKLFAKLVENCNKALKLNTHPVEEIFFQINVYFFTMC